MASGIANLGAARRGLIRSEKKSAELSDILGTASTTLAFLGVQAKKSKTAWEEYEEGYKAIGGTEAITRPKFGEKGWLKSTFKGPQGEVRIGGSIYDKANIQKAGGVLGSDIGAALSDEDRTSYLGRTAPGRKAPGSIEGFDYSSLIDPKTGKMVMSPEQYDIQVEGAQLYEPRFQDRQNQLEIRRQEQIDEERQLRSEQSNRQIQQDEYLEATRNLTGDPIANMQDYFKRQVQGPPTPPDFSKSMQRKMDKALGKWQQGSDPSMDYPSLGMSMSGSDYDKLVRDRNIQYAKDMYEPIGSMRRFERPSYDASYVDTGKVDVGPQIPQQNYSLPAMSSEEVARKKAQEEQWRLGRKGVQENPYMSGSPWSPDSESEDESFNPFKNLIETYGDKWK